jgi:hypothetical protein
MNNLPTLYTSIERKLFPMWEEEIGELSDKMRDFLRILEVVRPSRFITNHRILGSNFSFCVFVQ